MVKNLILSIISGADLLENARLTENEKRYLRGAMECNFTECDRLGVPFAAQNAALAAGRNNHRRRYCSDLCTEIMQRYHLQEARP